MYFTANPNGEAETVKIVLKPKPRMRILQFEKDFSDIEIKGRQAMGNLLTKSEIHKISLKQKGISTLGGRKVWFDKDVYRLNYDGRGQYLGEFQGEDKILIVHKNGEFYVTSFDLSNHFEPNILHIEKFDDAKVWTAALFDAEQSFGYIKRFTFESNEKKTSFLGENPDSQLYLLTSTVFPRLEVAFGGKDDYRENLEIDADEFIGIKSYKAKGKRISNFEIKNVIELEPLRFPEEEPKEEIEDKQDQNNDSDDSISNDDLLDELTGQMTLF